MVLLLCPLYAFAFQSNQKPNILFQGLKTRSHLEAPFGGSLESQVRSSLVSCKRINIITRDSTYWKNVRQELELKDFADEKTALQLGELSGASHYLDGTLIRYITERKTERLNDGTSTTSHNATAEVSLSLINLRSGKQETSFSIQKSVWAKKPDEARAACFAEVAEEVKAKFTHYFPIATTITNVNPKSREATIDAGDNDGVLPQSAYVLSSDKTVVVRVVDVGRESSTVRVLSGDISKLQAGSILNESFETTKNAVRVVSVNDGVAYIDGGENLDIKKGDIFVVSKRELVTNDPSPIYDESFPSALVVTEVKPDFAKARIAKGFSGVQKDTELVASNDQSLIKRHFVFAGYKLGLTPNIKANRTNEVVTVTNNVGEFPIPTNYNQNYKDISSVRIITFGFGTHNLAKRLATSLNADIYDIGNGTLKNWIAHLDVTHEGLVREDRFYLFYGGGLGYGGLKQRIPGSVMETISAGRSSEARATSWYASAKAGARLYIWHFALSLTCSYDLLKYKSWTYSAGNESDIKVPDALLPYPIVKLSGLYVSGTLSYSFSGK